MKSILKNYSVFIISIILSNGLLGCSTSDSHKSTDHSSDTEIDSISSAPLKVGYSIPVGGDKFKLDNLEYAKSVGVDYVEVSGMGAFVNKQGEFKVSQNKIKERLNWVKKNADKAGIKIWSVHMPFGENVDLSLTNEKERKKVVEVQRKLTEYLAILEPEYLVYHPSWYLGLNEREKRKQQLIKSVEQLDKKAEEINATMLIENMLGPKLLKNENKERPLLRTIDEVRKIIKRIPKSVYLVIDLNHIKHPEELILAVGDRIKSLHVNDGTGEREDHYFPCSGKGTQDWNQIFNALEEINYKGVFMYETTEYGDEKKLAKCYYTLYQNYLDSI